MGNQAIIAKEGYICPVRGCPKKKNRLFSLGGLFMHIVDVHGEAEAIKRLRAKKGRR